MGQYVLVAGGIRLAHRDVGVVADDVGRVVRRDGRGDQGGEEVVEGRLAAFLMPGSVAHLLRPGQTVPLGQPAHVFVVPDLIGRFKQGIHDAVDAGQDDEDAQQGANWPMATLSQHE